MFEVNKQAVYTEEQMKEALRLAQEGLRFKEIAEKLSLKEGTIKYFIERQGFKRTPEQKKALGKRKISPETENEIIADRKTGMSREQLADKYGLKVSGIKSILKRNGVILDKALVSKNVQEGRNRPEVMSVIKESMRKSWTDKRKKSHSEKLKTLFDSDHYREVFSKNAKDRWAEMTQEERSQRGQQYKESLLNRSEALGIGKSQYDDIASKNNGLFLGPWVNAHTKSEWQCSNGHTWWAKPNTIQSGHWCPSCACHSGNQYEKEIFDYIKSLLPDEDIKTNTREVINPLELDFYIPSKKFAIEFNGLFWHSSYFDSNRGKHFRKFKGCQNKGISLLAFFEDEWNNKKELLKAMIRHRIGVLPSTRYRASELELVRLDKNSEIESFFDSFHLDGHTTASYAFALKKDGKIVSCVSVRTNFNNEKEIARFATDYNVHVYGAAGRLIKAILEQEGTVYSFSNNRLSLGNVYKKLGANLVKMNPPSYWYTDSKVRVWRFKCKRINDPDILARFPDVAHTEEAQNEAGMQSEQIFGDNRPLYRIEDYGHQKWVLTLTNK